MVSDETRALVVHVAARAMQVDNAQILYEEIENKSLEFEPQSNEAAERFADALIEQAVTKDFWTEYEGEAGDWTMTEIVHAYLVHVEGRHLEPGGESVAAHKKHFDDNGEKLSVLSTAAFIALRILNPDYPAMVFPPELEDK